MVSPTGLYQACIIHGAKIMSKRTFMHGQVLHQLSATCQGWWAYVTTALSSLVMHFAAVSCRFFPRDASLVQNRPMDGWMEPGVCRQLQTTAAACKILSKHPQSTLLSSYLRAVVGLFRQGLLSHYWNNCDLQLRALPILAVSVRDPAHPRAVMDGTAVTITALVSVRLTGLWQSHVGKKPVQCVVAEVWQGSCLAQKKWNVCWLSLWKVIPSHGQKGVLLKNSLRIPLYKWYPWRWGRADFFFFQALSYKIADLQLWRTSKWMDFKSSF